MPAALGPGSRVAIVGGGPSGSFSAVFLLSLARRLGWDLHVDIYEPRDFTAPGPAGCNMCGGVVSESLVQALALEGIPLPPTVVQRGIDAYVLHTGEESVRIGTPLQEKRIAAVHRGGGPRQASDRGSGGLDAHLLSIARELGALVVPARVDELSWHDGRPEAHFGGRAETYDLLVGATGVNSTGLWLFEKLGLPVRRCETTTAYITEVGLEKEAITREFGGAMQVFLLDVPGLDCAAIIPKGNYVTVCLLGRKIDRGLVSAFFRDPAVRECLPAGSRWEEASCHCSPRINIRESRGPFADRVVLVGDCGVTRLYKDGIGAAYRTAKAAATTALFHGVSREDFRRWYGPVYREIARDNRFGRLIFTIVHAIRVAGPLRRAVARVVRIEQEKPGAERRMSIVLWDMFTGSAPYREIFLRSLHPRFIGRFVWESLRSVRRAGTVEREELVHG